MTVRELIAKLEALDPHYTVVLSEHSQYSEARDVDVLELFDNGGYFSHPFRVVDTQRVRNVVYIGT